MQIRLFRAEENKNKTYYAVTGASGKYEAIKAVIRKKKASMDTLKEYRSANGIIAPYKDGLDGLYSASAGVKGTACMIVWKG